MGMGMNVTAQDAFPGWPAEYQARIAAMERAVPGPGGPADRLAKGPSSRGGPRGSAAASGGPAPFPLPAGAAAKAPRVAATAGVVPAQRPAVGLSLGGAALQLPAGRARGLLDGPIPMLVLASQLVLLVVFRGNHLSNATCLTRAFFKSGEECSKSN